MQATTIILGEFLLSNNNKQQTHLHSVHASLTLSQDSCTFEAETNVTRSGGHKFEKHIYGSFLRDNGEGRKFRYKIVCVCVCVCVCVSILRQLDAAFTKKAS